MSLDFKFRILDVKKILHDGFVNVEQVNSREDSNNTSNKYHAGHIETEKEDPLDDIILARFVFVVDITIVVEAVEKHEVRQDDLDAAKNVVDVVSHPPDPLNIVCSEGTPLTERLEDKPR